MKVKDILDSLYTDGSIYFVSNPTPKKNETIKISIRLLHNDYNVKIYFVSKFNGAEGKILMNYDNTINNLDYYSVNINYYEDRLEYKFVIIIKNKVYYYNQAGISSYIKPLGEDFVILYDYDQPKWVKRSVFYQIFPDRFYNGNLDNDVLTDEYMFNGYKTIKREWNDKVLDYNHGRCLDFYGGDLEGIRKKIGYLKDLGVNALYLNPIFTAATNHRYDCLDYFNVDPHLGGNDALIELVEELHKNNMKIILDVSINHTGTAHKWFNKECVFFDKSFGAYHNKDSVERNYYFIDDNNNYLSWMGHDSLPQLDYRSKELQKIIYDSEDSFVKKWLKPPYNIDGWRFDVADVMARNKEIQLHHYLWPRIRKSIKDVKKDAYILCEDWSDTQEFLKGDEWDSSMNYYASSRPIREFLGLGDVFNLRDDIPITKINAIECKNRIEEYYSRLPFVIKENQFNLIDSHDIVRLHNCKKINFSEYRGAIIFLFSLIGCVNIYYADEANVSGTNSNEGCRHPYPWDNLDKILKSKQYNLYKTLAHLKTKEDVLINGGMKFLDPSKNVLGVIRFNLEEGIISLFALNDNIEYIKVDLYKYGFSNNLPKYDIFNNRIEYEVVNNSVIIKVMPKISLIFKVK